MQSEYLKRWLTDEKGQVVISKDLNSMDYIQRQLTHYTSLPDEDLKPDNDPRN